MTRPHSATATIGIAMGAAGTDVAMETADVVLVSDNLWNIPFAISISRHARTVIWQNLAIAMSVIVVLMASALGFSLPLTVGVVGHEGARYSSASMDYGSSRSTQRETSSQNLLSITPAPAAEAA
jgi:cation transport ATPase